MNIDITEIAMEELVKLAATKDEMKPIRIYVAAYGWGGPTFGLALDEQKDGDVELKLENFTFVIEEGLTDTYNNFKVDYSDNWMKRGFSVMPKGFTSGC